VVGISDDSIHQAVRNALIKARKTIPEYRLVRGQEPTRGSVNKKGEPTFQGNPDRISARQKFGGLSTIHSQRGLDALLQGGKLVGVRIELLNDAIRRAALLALGACRESSPDPLEIREFLLALIERIPFQDVHKGRVRFADCYRQKPNCLDAVLFEQRHSRVLEARDHGGQPCPACNDRFRSSIACLNHCYARAENQAAKFSCYNHRVRRDLFARKSQRGRRR